jgi:hypothetical protein
MGKTLVKGSSEVAGAVAIQANSTWLFSGATVILTILKKINAQNGTCPCGLQKFGCKKLVLKLDSFGNETPRGDWLAICTLKQGARWTGIGHAGNNTQCCPGVHTVPIVCQLVC